MRKPARKAPENTREFLPATQQVNFVPMSAEDFQREKTRKILIWGGIVLGVILVCSFIMWRSSKPVSARLDLAEAIGLFHGGKYNEALQSVDDAIKGNAPQDEAYMLRARIHRALNLTQEASDDLTRVIHVRSDYPDAYALRAQTYGDLGQNQKALEDYNRVIQLHPTAQAFVGRGICYRDLGQIQRAIEDFSKAVELEPSADNYLQRGMAFAAAGDHTRALADYDQVIEIRPDVPYTYRARAYERDATGNHAGAKSDRDAARKMEVPSYIESAAILPKN